MLIFPLLPFLFIFQKFFSAGFLFENNGILRIESIAFDFDPSIAISFYYYSRTTIDRNLRV